jgi:hypothetical protein
MNFMNERLSGHVASRPSAAPAGPQASAAPAGPAAERDPAAIGAFIERFAGVLHESGVPRMPARVFTALLAADAGRLTAADIAAVLGVSPAAVSGAVRYLLQVGLATSAGEPGSRRLSYGVPDHVWQLLLRAHIGTMTRWSTAMADGVALLGAGTPAGDRMAESSRFFQFVTTELPGILARWEEYSSPAGGDTHPDGAGRDGARPGGPA